MKLFLKLLKVFGWLFVAYFLLFVVTVSVYYLYIQYYPPMSEFSGMGIFIMFSPFFSFAEWIDNFIGGFPNFLIGFVIWFLLFVVINFLLLRPRLKWGIFLSLFPLFFVAILYLFYTINPSRVANGPEGIFELGKEAGIKGDYELCLNEIPGNQISLREQCTGIAAVFSGDKTFCDEHHRSKEWCLNYVETANNFVKLKCAEDLSREKCLSKYCFHPYGFDSVLNFYESNIVWCMVDQAEGDGDKKWCEGIYGDTNKDESEMCFKNVTDKEVSTDTVAGASNAFRTKESNDGRYKAYVDFPDIMIYDDEKKLSKRLMSISEGAEGVDFFWSPDDRYLAMSVYNPFAESYQKSFFTKLFLLGIGDGDLIAKKEYPLKIRYECHDAGCNVSNEDLYFEDEDTLIYRTWDDDYYEAAGNDEFLRRLEF